MEKVLKNLLKRQELLAKQLNSLEESRNFRITLATTNKSFRQLRLNYVRARLKAQAIKQLLYSWA